MLDLSSSSSSSSPALTLHEHLNVDSPLTVTKLVDIDPPPQQTTVVAKLPVIVFVCPQLPEEQAAPMVHVSRRSRFLLQLLVGLLVQLLHCCCEAVLPDGKHVSGFGFMQVFTQVVRSDDGALTVVPVFATEANSSKQSASPTHVSA
jgi:hypothetical protein